MNSEARSQDTTIWRTGFRALFSRLVKTVSKAAVVSKRKFLLVYFLVPPPGAEFLRPQVEDGILSIPHFR